MCKDCSYAKTELEVYDAIKPKLGEDEAKMLLKFMERTTSELVTKVDLLATKDDLKADLLVTKADLKADLLVTKADLKADLLVTKADLKAELADIKVQFEVRLGQTDSRITWKLLAISGGQLAILLAIVKLFLT